MRLKVSYRERGAQPERRDVAITADARTTPRDAATALWFGAGHTADGGGRLTLRVVGARGSRSLDPHQPLVDGGVVSGDVVEVAFAEDRSALRGPAGATLTVVAGPDVGLSVPLPVGSSDIGRSTECDVRLNDPTVSGVHARINVGDDVEVVDRRSANGVIVGGQRVSRGRIRAGDTIELGATTLRITSHRVPGAGGGPTTDRFVVRPPRVLRRPREREVQLPKTPDPPEPQPFPWLATLAPLLLGVVMFAVTQSLLSVVFIALSPLLMLGAHLDQVLQVRRKARTQAATFRQGLELARQGCAEENAADLAALRALHPSLAECLRAVAEPSGLLWSRRPEHPEFLQVRLGQGRCASRLRIAAPEPGGVAELVAEAVRVRAAASVLDEAPVVADLRQAGGLGCCGDDGRVDDVARGLIAQVLALHSPAELAVACLTSAAGRDRWGWLPWTPHSSSAHSPLAAAHLASDPGSGAELLAALEDLVGARVEAARDRASDADEGRGPCPDGEGARAPAVPTILLLVDDAPVDQARLTRLAERGPDAGLHVIWIARDRLMLPGACRSYLDVGRGAEPAEAGMVRTEAAVTPVLVETLDADGAHAFARHLAPLVDSGVPVDDDSDLPRVVPLVTLLDATGDEAAEGARILDRWVENGSRVDRAPATGTPHRPFPGDLRALVGYDATQPLALDLRLHGPHALVGGTTGSGKSEFLQAWVLGMAYAYSPDRLTFLFVDYKGGSAFSRCTELPHSVGLVTDLSPALVRRALTSLRAEIRHREEVLNRKGVKDLMELERLGDPECPPSLVVVVDEFAALVTEVPEFVDGMVDVAQRGRSLGINLILATQRPEGVIKDNLRANTNLRVALRMSDEHNSTDVLGSPMAAHIDAALPGRGAVKFGPGRITPFQSAFPGSRTADDPPAPPVEIRDLGFGAGALWPSPPRPTVDRQAPTDLDRVVRAIGAAAARAHIPAPRKPWLPSLAPLYRLERLGQRSDAEMVLGVVDDPERQRQITDYFRPDHEGNILYIGTGSSGKSTALRSLAAAASITPRGGPVHIYALDFAGGALAALQELPTVGAVIGGDDDERVARLLRQLAGLLEERAARYAGVRAATLTDYRRLADAPLEPRILVLLDGFAAFRTAYESTSARLALYDVFLRVLVEGRGLGIHVAMTGDRPGAVPLSVAAAFQRRLVFRQSDPDAYRDLGVPPDVLGPESPPGRCLEAGRGLEMQIAVIGSSLSLAVQARELQRLGVAVRAHLAVPPTPIARLPEVIAAGSLPAAVGGLPVLGVADDTLAPIGFEPSGVVLVAGPAGSGRTSTLRWLAESLRRSRSGLPLIRLGARPSWLAEAVRWEVSAVGVEESTDTLRGILADLASQEGAGPVAVFVEAVADLVGTEAEAELEQVVRAAKARQLLLVAEAETSEWAGGWGPLNDIRNARTGLLLQPEQHDGESLLRAQLPAFRQADLPPGRGFWIRGAHVAKVQIPLVE